MSFHPQMPYGSGWHKSERRFAEPGPPFAFWPHSSKISAAIPVWCAWTTAGGSPSQLSAGTKVARTRWPNG